MKKLNLRENGDFSITSRRYVLSGRKHGDTAYVHLTDTFDGLIYENNISWNDILLLIRDRITWEKFIYDVILWYPV